MIEINLIPDVKQELLKAQRQRAGVISVSIFTSIVAGGVVAALLIYIFAIQNVRGALLDGQITDKYATLSEVEDISKIITIQNQVNKLSELNGERTMNSRLFDVIAAVTPPGENAIKFSKVNVNAADSTIILEGQASGFSATEVFRKTLDSAEFSFSQDGESKTVKLASNISMTEVSYGEDETGQRVLRFVLSFTYPTELFASTTGSPVFKLSIDGNVTDSYLGIPRSLFTERARDI